MEKLISCLIIGTLVFILPLPDIKAQDNRFSEEEIAIERQFIEAKKYKILGDLDAAKKVLEQLLAKHSNLHAAAYELAEILIQETKWDDALHHIDLALKTEPKNSWYLKLKANILSESKKFEQAALVYEQINALEPDNPYDLEKKAWLYAKAGQLEKSIHVLEQLEQKIGITEKTAYARFDLYKQLGKKTHATEVLEGLIRVDSKNLEHRHVLATYLRQIGKNPQADLIYKEILSIDPTDARANVALASTLKKEGNSQGYLSSIKSVIENPEADIDVKIAELMPYLKQFQVKNETSLQSNLEELAGLLVKSHPNEAKAHAFQADVFSLSGKSENALVAYRKTLELDESNYLVWEQTLLLMVELQKKEDLIRYSEEAMELFPNQAMIYYLNGLGNYQQQHYEEAIGSLEQALLMSGKNQNLKVNIQALLGKTYHELRDFEKSDVIFDQAILSSPGDARLMNDYAFCLADRGDRLEEAGKMCEKALEKEPSNPRYLATKAWLAYRQNQIDQARILMEAALKHGGDRYGFIIEKYGDIWFRLDQKEKALKYWKEALETGSGSKWLPKKIEEEKLIEQQ